MKQSERATGLEPATSSLGSWHSTTELRPRISGNVSRSVRGVKEALFRDRGLQKTSQVGLTDRRFSRGDIIQPALLHPLLQFSDQIKKMIEGIDDEEQWLVMIDFEILIDDPFELDRIALYFRRINGVRNFAVGAQESAAIHT